MEKVNRKSNIELLRIFAMILIVFHHLSVHSDFSSSSFILFNKEVNELLAFGGQLGVDIFILISGYFMINSKFKLSKLLKLILTVFTYSISIYLIFVGCGVVSFDIGQLLACFFSILTGKYWFFTSYVILYCLTPFINKAIHSMNRKSNLLLITLLTTIWATTSFIFKNTYEFSSLGWFINMYMIGAYIRKYNDIKENSSKNYLLYSVLTFIISFSILLICKVLNSKFDTEIITEGITNMNSIFMVLLSIFIFKFFNSLNIKSNKIINIVSSGVFGVYLIHDNILMRDWLWNYFIRAQRYSSSYLFILYAIGVCLAIYVVCTLIELIRIYVIEKQTDKLINIVSDKIINVSKKFDNKYLSRLEEHEDQSNV